MKRKNNSGGSPGVKSTTNLFFSGVLVLTISNLIIKVIGMLFKIPMSHFVGDEGMGYYSQAYTLYTCFFMIATNGLPVALATMLSDSRSKGQFKQAKRIFRIAMGLFFAVGLVSMLVMLFGARIYSSEFLRVDQAYYCILAVAPTIFFISISSAYRGYFQSYQQMLPTSVSQLTEVLSKLFLGVFFALYAKGQGYGIHIVAAYAAAGLTIGAALGMIFLFFAKLAFRSKEEQYNVQIIEGNTISEYTDSTATILKRIAIIAIPITLSSSVMSITNLIDSGLVSTGLQDIGMTAEEATKIYGNYTTLAVTMFNLPPYLIYPISYSIIPILTMARSTKDTVRANRIIESSLRVSVLIGLPCALGMSALSKPILSLLFPMESVEMAWPLLSLLAPASFFICVLSVTNAILQSCGYERMPLYSMLVGAAIKLVSNYILIRTIGMYGTPVSTFLCYLTATAMNLYFVAKKTGVMPSVSRVFLRPLLAAVLCALAALGSYTLFSDVLGLGGRAITLAAIFIAVIVYGGLVFTTRAITADDILLLPKGEKILSVLKKIKLVRV
ncbi:MAG: polysaccharide biosynthesis protein [Clostridia bacterium]|nr:polysaccharide biosynthesis protein [Clostridia bacterium]